MLVKIKSVSLFLSC